METMGQSLEAPEALPPQSQGQAGGEQGASGEAWWDKVAPEEVERFWESAKGQEALKGRLGRQVQGLLDRAQDALRAGKPLGDIHPKLAQLARDVDETASRRTAEALQQQQAQQQQQELMERWDHLTPQQRAQHAVASVDAAIQEQRRSAAWETELAPHVNAQTTKALAKAAQEAYRLDEGQWQTIVQAVQKDVADLGLDTRTVEGATTAHALVMAKARDYAVYDRSEQLRAELTADFDKKLEAVRAAAFGEKQRTATGPDIGQSAGASARKEDILEILDNEGAPEAQRLAAYIARHGFNPLT